MPFFEFDDGRLVPAQFGHPVPEDIEPDILEAVRDQVLEVVQRPLFPISWHGDGRRPGTYRPAGAPAPRLTALDATGQVVTVEVVEELDSAALVDALSRSARNAGLGWSQLADLYPRGVAAFRRDWNAFRELLPPKPPAGPRLVIVAGAVLDEVRPALQVLAESGVVVHELALRQMSNGRRFLEVNELRPGQVDVGRVLAAGVRHNELTAESSTWTGGQAAVRSDGVTPDGATPDGVPPAPAVSPTAPASPASPVSPTSPASPDAAASDVVALADIAATLEGETPLVWSQLRRGIRHDAVLTADGEIRLSGGDTFTDPDLAARAVSGRDDVDGWRVWRFGESGPSLSDARAELRAARDREPRGHRSADRARRAVLR